MNQLSTYPKKSVIIVVFYLIQSLALGDLYLQTKQFIIIRVVRKTRIVVYKLPAIIIKKYLLEKIKYFVKW